MRVYYFNDRTTPRLVFIDTLFAQVKLAPHEGRIFDVQSGLNEIAYIKEWDDYTLISTIYKEFKDEIDPT